MGKSIAIAGVAERDIDLLLLEEFQSSPPFQEWFVSLALGPSRKLGRCVAAKRSVMHSIGESDLEVTFLDSTGAVTRLMIENKVNAGLQPMQAERYRERGTRYVALGECAAFHTIIIAPARYFGGAENTKGFSSQITYEQLLAWFQKAPELGDRRNYKLALLNSAIEKGILGYQMEEDAPNSRFWTAYWEIASTRAPEFEMRKPKPKPSRSGFIGFHPALPPDVKLFHKFNFGYVDLQLAGKGARINEVSAVFGMPLPNGMTVESAAKSAAIRRKVPKLRSSIGFEEQLADIHAGIDAAKQMLAWFRSHEDAWVSYTSTTGQILKR